MTVAFSGQNSFNATPKISARLNSIIEILISEKGADNFIFASGNKFDGFCMETVLNLKKKFPDIKYKSGVCGTGLVDDCDVLIAFFGEGATDEENSTVE